MPVKKTEKIWHNGKFINWEDATIHVISHVVSYGTAFFEGIRCYNGKQGPAIFRLRDHMQRLVNSAKVYRTELPFSTEELCAAACELVRVNKVNSCYIRPIALRGYGEVGVSATQNPVEVYLACWEWGTYLGAEALRSGVDVCVSSWARMAPNTLPTMAKVAANYMNSQLIHMEAHLNGYAEGIALDTEGCVSEGAGENIFVAREGRLYTPPLSSSVLPGITRECILTLCGDLGVRVEEQRIPREMLYLADEVFFVGTAAEITPIRSVDHIQVGAGQGGPIARRLQDEFFALTSGEKPDRHHWLTPVNIPVNAGAR